MLFPRSGVLWEVWSVWWRSGKPRVTRFIFYFGFENTLFASGRGSIFFVGLERYNKTLPTPLCSKHDGCCRMYLQSKLADCRLFKIQLTYWQLHRPKSFKRNGPTKNQRLHQRPLEKTKQSKIFQFRTGHARGNEH